MSSIEEGADQPRPLCSICNRNFARQYYKIVGRKRVKAGYGKKCSSCTRGGFSDSKKKAWLVHRKDYCENEDCTATIENKVQLTVDHIDGDKNNNDPENLMTLCANCHALKTYLNRDFLNLAHRRDKIE